MRIRPIENLWRKMEGIDHHEVQMDHLTPDAQSCVREIHKNRRTRGWSVGAFFILPLAGAVGAQLMDNPMMLTLAPAGFASPVMTEIQHKAIKKSLTKLAELHRDGGLIQEQFRSEHAAAMRAWKPSHISAGGNTVHFIRPKTGQNVFQKFISAYLPKTRREKV